MLVLVCLDADAKRLSLDEKSNKIIEHQVALSETKGMCHSKGNVTPQDLTSKKDTATPDDDDKNKGQGSYGNPSGSGDQSNDQRCFDHSDPPTKHN